MSNLPMSNSNKSIPLIRVKITVNVHYLVYSKLSTRFEEIIHIFLTFWHCKFGLRGKKKEKRV